MSRRKPSGSRALFLADLARSGLTAADAQRLKLRLLTPGAVSRLTDGQHRVVAYRIPYHFPTGKSTGYFRLRLLHDPQAGDKAARYWQPRGSLPRLFFPRTRRFDLAKALADVTETLCITEGEKKADRGCLADLVTVGVGGVWNWKSPRAGTNSGAIGDFDLIAWEGRSVLFAFDSDVATKPSVQEALRALAREVTSRGAKPRMVRLPGGADGAKVGLDDFLEGSGRSAFDALEPEVLNGNLAEELWRLNEELVCIESPPAVWRLKTQEFLTTEQLKLAYQNRKVLVPGERSARQVSVSKEWLEWGLRREAPRVVFEPAEAPGITAAGEVNLWRGWGMEPKPGSVQPWDDLLTFMFDGDLAARAWFEDWCAYPLQHPGAKLYSAVVLFSLEQGVGKSLVGETLKRIYGDAGVTLTQEQLGSPFNGWAARRLFALGDEVTGSDKRRDADRFKSLITQETVTVNEKYQPQYVLKDRLNYLFTTNHPDAFSLEDDDRRFFIHQIHQAKQPDDFYKNYDRWLWGDGPAHLFHHLLKRRLEGFNPRGSALQTESKQAMKELSRSDLDAFAHQLKADPSSVLRLDGHAVSHQQLVTLTELLGFVDPGGSRRTTGIALSKALTRAKLRQTKQVRLTTGPTRLWVLADEGKWLKASHAELKAEREKGAVKLTALEGGRKF